MTEVRSKTENKGIVIGGWKDTAPKETHAVSNMTRVRKAKEKANAIDRVLFLPGYVPKSAGPSGKVKQPFRVTATRKASARNRLVIIGTFPTRGCKFGDTCFHCENSEAPKQKDKTYSKADEATIAIVRSFSDESQDIESLPEQIGWTYERDTVHPEEKRQRIFKDPKYTNTAKHFSNIRERLGTITWASSKVVLHIVAAPTLLRLQAQIQIILCEQETPQKTAAWQMGPTSCTDFAEKHLEKGATFLSPNMEW